jgi:hypothetical protein
MLTATKSVKDLIEEFSKATIEKDFTAIEKLLDEQGVFEIQDNKQELIEVSKEEFLIWYENKLQDVTISEHHYDQCIGCSFGQQVVLFNDGAFPRIQKDTSDRSKTGFMIDSKDEKIIKIAFCFVFLKTENKYIFECIGNIIKVDINSGSSYKEALEKFNKNPSYNHLKFDANNTK